MIIKISRIFHSHINWALRFRATFPCNNSMKRNGCFTDISTNKKYTKNFVSIDSFLFDGMVNADMRGQFCSPYGQGTSTCHSLETALFLLTTFDICFLFHRGSRRRFVMACLVNGWTNLQILFRRFIVSLTVLFFVFLKYDLHLKSSLRYFYTLF